MSSTFPLIPFVHPLSRIPCDINEIIGSMTEMQVAACMCKIQKQHQNTHRNGRNKRTRPKESRVRGAACVFKTAYNLSAEV